MEWWRVVLIGSLLLLEFLGRGFKILQQYTEMSNIRCGRQSL